MKQGIRRLVVLTGLAAAVAALTVPMLVPFQVRIVYNPSDSVARGWYLIAPMTNPSALQPGRVVLARLPAGAAAFAVTCPKACPSSSVWAPWRHSRCASKTAWCASTVLQWQQSERTMARTGRCCFGHGVVR